MEDKYRIQIQRKSKIDPFIFDLHRSIRLIEQYGETLEKIVFLHRQPSEDITDAIKISEMRKEGDMTIDYNTLKLVPFRSDVCECQNLLRCPNGTKSNAGSSTLDDCFSAQNEVLRRYSIVPSMQWVNFSQVKNGTDFSELGGSPHQNNIGSFEMESVSTLGKTC